MDELDLKIIGILQSDGRASNAKIARAVGVSEGTVRRRLRRLIKDDIVHVVAVPNLEKMGYGTTALIGLETVPASPTRWRSPSPTWTKPITSSWQPDPTTCLSGRPWNPRKSLGDFLRTRIGVIDGVQKTQTFVTLSTKKRFTRV